MLRATLWALCVLKQMTHWPVIYYSYFFLPLIAVFHSFFHRKFTYWHLYFLLLSVIAIVFRFRDGDMQNTTQRTQRHGARASATKSRWNGIQTFRLGIKHIHIYCMLFSRLLSFRSCYTCQSNVVREMKKNVDGISWWKWKIRLWRHQYTILILARECNLL